MRHILAISLLTIVSVTKAFGQCSDAAKKKPEPFNSARGEANRRGERAFLQNVRGGIHVLERYGDRRLAKSTTGYKSAQASILLRMEREWNDALRTRNLAWFERNLASDVTDISSGNGVLQTKAEDIAALKADKTVYESLELSDLKVRVEGNAGIVTGINHIRGHDEQGQAFDVRLSFTDTYIKRDGRWQVWASQHTRVRP